MRPGDIAALMDWWKLAGVDTLVSAEPAAWLTPAGLDDPEFEQQATPAFDPPAPRVPAPIAPASREPVSREEAWWETADSLAKLSALVASRNPRAPFADGTADSGLMILGEGPSAEDLKTGRPFSGPAGIFLDRMLAAIGVTRATSYIALLCPRRRIPGPPTPEDIAADLALTRAHIRLARPRHLLLLGSNPAQALTGEQAPITRLRGQWLSVTPAADMPPIPALASFNPAYLLRRPEEKAKAWADLLALKHRIYS